MLHQSPSNLVGGLSLHQSPSYLVGGSSLHQSPSNLVGGSSLHQSPSNLVGGSSLHQSPSNLVGARRSPRAHRTRLGTRGSINQAWWPGARSSTNQLLLVAACRTQRFHSRFPPWRHEFPWGAVSSSVRGFSQSQPSWLIVSGRGSSLRWQTCFRSRTNDVPHPDIDLGNVVGI